MSLKSINRISTALKHFSRESRRRFCTEKAKAHEAFKRGGQFFDLAIERDKLVLGDKEPVTG